MAGVVYVKRGQELPHVRHNWFQMAPMHTPQGTNEPFSQDGDTSGKKIFKGKMLQVFWQELQPVGDSWDQSVPDGPYPMEKTHAGAIPEELRPVGRT